MIMKPTPGGPWADSPPDCYEVLQGFDAAIQASLPEGNRYFMLGGIASGALQDPATVIDKASQTIIPPADSALPVMRPNGTRRDVDILVDDVLSDEDGKRVKAAVEEVVDGQLTVSVFGFDRYVERPNVVQRAARTAMGWVSSRTIDEAGTIRYEMYPLARPVDSASFDPWKLQLPSGDMVEVLHPAGHTLAYRLRSIGGPRPKDAEKREAMDRNVLPLFKEEVNDGIFRDWLEFGEDVRLLKDGWMRYDSMRGEDLDGQGVTAFRAKSKTSAWAERHPEIVDLLLNDNVQRALNLFVRAK